MAKRIKTKDRPKCGVCGCHHYWLSKATDGRPRFECANCGNTWTNGLSGEPYIKHARKRPT